MEKQLQIFTHEEFGQVRVIEIDGAPWFVASDVCRVLELGNPSQALSRLDDDEKGLHFIPATGIISKDTHGGQEMLVVNESGLYALVMTSRKHEAKKFRKWITSEVVPQIFRTGSYSIAQPQSQSVLLKAASEIDPLSAILQNTFAVKRGIALSQAIDIVGNNYKLNFNSLKQLLPPADHETGYLNPTQIGERLGGLSAKVVNKLLAEAGLQYRDGKDWRLTDMGKEFGEEMPYTRNGHSGYQIRWNEAIVDYLTGKAA